MMGYIMISVIIPVYNSAPYLEQCLNSVLSQTYPNLEVICVDDGSTDISKHIIQKFVEEDSRVILVSQPNSGVSTARNAGLDIAHGEYITFVDSDDEIEPDMYETLLDLLLRYKADIAHCGYKKMHLDGTVKDVLGTGELLVQDSSEASKCLITGQHFVGSPCTKLYKQELFSNIRFVPELKINEDVLVNAQLFNRAQKIVF